VWVIELIEQPDVYHYSIGENSYLKIAIVAEGLSANRRANLHFVVDSVADANSYTLGTDTKMFIDGLTGNVGIGRRIPKPN